MDGKLVDVDIMPADRKNDITVLIGCTVKRLMKE